MSMLCGLAAFALKSVTGLEADGLARWAAERFTDHTRGVPLALSLAHDRAWLALSLALAEEGLWGKLGDLGRDGDLKAIRELARGLITAKPPNFRASCLREWNAMHKAGRLKLPPLPADPTALVAHPALAVRSVDDALVGLVRDLEKEAPSLAAAALLTPPGGVPLFASAFLFFFRREMEKDAETSRGLLLDKVDFLAGDQRRGFDALEQAVRLSGERVLHSLQQMNDEMLGELQSCRNEMRQLREALRVQPSPAEAPIAVSANTEAERERLRHLRDRLRTLPSDVADANVMAALFDATGEYKEAMAAHRESARLAKARADRAAEAEAHYKAYRDACELQAWPAAKESLALAVRLDGPRFRPFDTARYEMVRVLGAGGFGTVFECLDHYEHGDDGRPVRVAVKSLRPDGLERGPAEVFREAKVLKQLGQSGGSRVIGVSHWGYAVPDPDRPGAGRGPFIVMEYFDGETLETLVNRDGPLAVPDLLAVARQMAEALRDAHGKSVLHRDLKPGNVMARRVGDAWDVRVIDFGLAVRHEAQAMAGQALMSTARGRSLTGSIDFAPPEQKGRLPGVRPGPYSDVYAWGKTCQWLLFKTTEVRGPHWKRLPDDVRGPIQELLDAATMDELIDRLKDFTEVLKGLDGLEGKAAPVSWLQQGGLLADDMCEPSGTTVEEPEPVKPAPVKRTGGANAERLWRNLDPQSAENLERWLASAEPLVWVTNMKGNWDHDNLHELLIMLRYDHFRPIRGDWAEVEQAVREALAAARNNWLNNRVEVEAAVRAAENLKMWVADGLAGEWVERMKGHWEFGQWRELLAELRRDGWFWPMEEDAVREALEAARDKWLAEQQSSSTVLSPGDILTIDKMKFAWIPPGWFMMGSDKSDDEKPMHKVTITKGFYMGIYPVTQAEWAWVMGSDNRPSHPHRIKSDDLAVEPVSWDEAQAFLVRLKNLIQKAGRLPTEAEWEYACRAGTTTDYYNGDGEGCIGEVGWSITNWKLQPHPVGKKKPNAWGLHDMHGNVWEWCSDWHGPYTAGEQADPTGPEEGTKKVLRGGSYVSDAWRCRAASRNAFPTDCVGRGFVSGFRVCFNPD